VKTGVAATAGSRYDNQAKVCIAATASMQHQLISISFKDPMNRNDIYEKLKELDIVLPASAAPAAAYAMTAQSGNIVYVSGHIAKRNGSVWVGKLGASMATEDGRVAARSVAIDLLATLHAHTGDLNRVRRIVKLISMVNSTPDFTEQHLMTNGASELLADVFGDRGRHARSAFGVAQLPLGACVEIEICAEVG
jgi:enamine deaminase RidA (YjgF/YER057c/UK114 family)